MRNAVKRTESSAGTFAAPVFTPVEGISALSQGDDPATAAALRRLVRRRILQLREIEFVRAVVNVEFRLELFAADRAIRPLSGMLFGMVKTA